MELLQVLPQQIPLRTQRQMAQQRVDAGGASVMVVTETQPQVGEDRPTLLALAPMTGERRTTAATVDRRHGRLAQRRLQTRSGLPWKTE